MSTDRISSSEAIIDMFLRENQRFVAAIQRHRDETPRCPSNANDESMAIYRELVDRANAKLWSVLEI